MYKILIEPFKNEYSDGMNFNTLINLIIECNNVGLKIKDIKTK